MRKLTCLFLLMTLSLSTYAQEFSQNIRGQILDISSEESLPFANIIIKDSKPILGTTSNLDGTFILKNIPIGRYDIEISYLGYESIILPEVVVTSAKEVILTVRLKEQTNVLKEVVIKPKVLKENPLNQMAMVSARMLSIEEANRYAGGFDDPGRLASSFAGVSSSVGNNAIIIRGNAPKFLQWKIEGIEIPNPNHFADLSVFGGGGLTALSSNLLANSDFYTGAFPAEYTNALSGVFDIRMRSGNTSNHEHSVELGAIGIDLASEGPISKSSRSSYLINYRYSTLGLISSLLPEEAQGTNYQDLSFKLKLPTKKHGVFSIWGIGLLDNSGSKPKKEIGLQFYYQDIEKQDAQQYMGTIGLNHRIILTDKSYLNSTIAFTSNGVNLETHRLNETNSLRPLNIIDIADQNISIYTYLNTKLNAKHSNRTGLNLRLLNYNYNLSETKYLNKDLIEVVEEDGTSALISGYSSSSYNFQSWTINAGISGQLFTLNGSYSVEPRLGVSYQYDDTHKFSIGYGLHSRIEALSIYLAQTTNSTESQANHNLGFTKAHHLVLSYDWNITDKMHLKVEPYYQILTNVPVIQNSTTSLLNLKNSWFINDTYVNKGKGRNYGLDLTIEQYIDNGFYFLVSGSIFQSQYKSDNTKWFNTRYNKNYLANLLLGKEFRIGKNQNLLGFNIKFSTQGGERYSPIDITASVLEKDVILDERKPFIKSTNPRLLIHFTINYEWYRASTTHKISFKILNATNQKEFQGLRYNLESDTVEEFQEALIIPNISYKFSF